MISTYTVPLAQVDQVRAAHMSFLDGLEERKIAVSAGRQDPPTGGVVVLDVATEDEARAIMAADPYVTQGVAEYRQAVGFKPSRGVLAQL